MEVNGEEIVDGEVVGHVDHLLDGSPRVAEIIAVPANVAPNPATPLHRLLQNHHSTSHLLERSHDPHDRYLVVRAIIDKLIQDERARSPYTPLRIRRNRYLFWAEQIVALITAESAQTYYSPYRGPPNRRRVSGMLTDRFNNVKRSISTRFGRPVRNQAAQERLAAHDLIDQLHGTSLDAVGRITQLWSATFEVRDREGTIARYYANFFQLRTPSGANLILSDYDSMHLSDGNLLRLKWPTVAATIVQLARSRRSCAHLFDNAGTIHTNFFFKLM